MAVCDSASIHREQIDSGGGLFLATFDLLTGFVERRRFLEAVGGCYPADQIDRRSFR